jgi:hypothetical protein
MCCRKELAMDKLLNRPADENRQMNFPKETYQINMRRTDLGNNDRIGKYKKLFTDDQTPDEHLKATYWG